MQNRIVELRKVARLCLSPRRLPHEGPPGPCYLRQGQELEEEGRKHFQGGRRFIRSQPKVAAMVEMVREVEVIRRKTRRKPFARRQALSSEHALK